MPKKRASLIPTERIERAIILIRGEKVMLDADLAALYGVSTGHLNRAVQRNRDRFPPDFMLQLAEEEFEALKCHFGISNQRGGRRRSRPSAFTEQGVAMLSSVLRSQRAVEVNIEIMRAFVRLRQILASHADLARKVDELEQKFDGRKLVTPPAEPPKELGFHTLVKRGDDGKPSALKPRRRITGLA